MQLIGLSGYARSGKDEVAKILVADFGYERVAFADKLREALYALNPQAGNFTVRGWVDAVGWDAAKSRNPEIRRLLQVLGTEAGRDIHGQDTWVNSAFAPLSAEGNYVFTDMRFPNEYEAITQHYGQVWRISRPGVWPVTSHTSETALDGCYTFDYEIDNNGTIEDLRAIVRSIMVYPHPLDHLIGTQSTNQKEE